MVTVSMGIGASKQSSTRKLVQTAIINALNRSTQSCAQQAAGEQNIIITGNNNKIQNVTLSQMSKIIGGCLNSQEVKQEFMNTLQQNLKDIAEHKQHGIGDFLRLDFEQYDSNLNVTDVTTTNMTVETIQTCLNTLSLNQNLIIAGNFNELMNIGLNQTMENIMQCQQGQVSMGKLVNDLSNQVEASRTNARIDFTTVIVFITIAIALVVAGFIAVKYGANATRQGRAAKLAMGAGGGLSALPPLPSRIPMPTGIPRPRRSSY